MSTPAKIGLFTLAVTGFYTYVGAIVPQMESHPPKSTEVRLDMSPTELAAAGREVFFSKGTCALCHTIGETDQRCPDLAGIGARAASRIAGLGAPEYLAQSLLQPNEYIVDGYTPTMPRIDRPPIGLDESEIVAVVAFLESLGGEISVTPSTRFASSEAPEAEAPTPSSSSGSLEATAIIQSYGCAACHHFEQPLRLLGPSLYDLGSRQDPATILQSLVDPDAVIAEGDPPYLPGLMSATLDATGFYEKVSLAELRTLADHLSKLRGGSR